MAKYQIEATIEKFEIDATSGSLTVQLKGYGKYCFEDNKKEYWNIFECLDDTSSSKFKEQEAPISSEISKEKVGMHHLLGYALCERKKLKFELQFVPEAENKPKHYIITGISHASS
jgi:hypothetical protein